MLGREPRVGPAEGTVDHVPEVPLGRPTSIISPHRQHTHGSDRA